MSEYYYLSSSLDETGFFVDSWVTESNPQPCINCGPVTSSVEGEYILLDTYKEQFEKNLYKGIISLSAEQRLRRILFTQRYKEEDRDFLQGCAEALILNPYINDEP